MVKYSNKILIELLIVFVLATLVISFFYVAKVFIISGNSMLPTLENGERILVDKRAYVYVEPIKDDIVGLKDPYEPSLQYVKRVVASSGDTIELSGGEVKVNDVSVYKTSDDNFPKKTIPSNFYFVMGDNREVSYDSREFGLVPKSNIIGKAVAVVWPVNKIRMIK